MTAKSETPAAPDIAETLRQLAAANDAEALMFAGITPQPVSPRYKLQ